jgi:hypothetical protein
MLGSSSDRQLIDAPVTRQFTMFAQDTFIDAIYQEAGGAWLDAVHGNDRIATLSEEMTTEVAAAHKRTQPLNQQGNAATGSCLLFSTHRRLTEVC